MSNYSRLGPPLPLARGQVLEQVYYNPTLISSGVATRQYSTIAAALADAVSGDIVKVPVGTFTEKNLVVPAGVSLDGYGRYSSIISASNATDTSSLLRTYGNTRISNLSIINTHVSDGNALYGCETDPTLLTVIDNCELSGNMDVIVLGAGIWNVRNNHFRCNGFDIILNANNSPLAVIENNTCIATPTYVGECSFLYNAGNDLVILRNNYVKLTRAANEYTLSFVRDCLNVKSQGNVVDINAGNKNAYGWTFSGYLGESKCKSYNDNIALTSSDTATHVKDSEGNTGTFAISGGNVTSYTSDDGGITMVNETSRVISVLDDATAPGTLSGVGQLYIDVADDKLKIKFGDGTVVELATNT